MKPYFRRLVTVAAASLLLAASVFPQTAPTVIRNASVVDGSGRPAFTADVRIRDGRIVKVGRIRPRRGETVVDAAGKVLAPGFVDIHNHSEDGLLTEGAAGNQVSQGITTIMVGPDGGSPFPILGYLEQLKGKIGPNVGTFIGHATLREQVMNGDYRRKSTPEELQKMLDLMERAMAEGAFGLSSGLEYDIGFSSSTEELIELAKVAARYGGIYMTHMRDEEEGMLDAIREALRIGKEAKIPVQISHFKAGNRNVWGKSTEAIALVDAARRGGLDVTADVYPYTAWASTITVLVPSRRHDDRSEIERGLSNVGGADKVLVTSCRAHPDYEGKTLRQIADEQQTSPVDVYIRIVRDGGAGVVCNSMNEADVRNFLSAPWSMVSSDGGIGSRHPRGTGTFTRVLGRLVRDNKWMAFEEAVRKMTSFPAQRLGLKDRGLIRKGFIADVVLIDRERVIDRATFSEPQKLSEGIEIVWVGGVRVWENGKTTGNLPGKILNKRSK